MADSSNSAQDRLGAVVENYRLVAVVGAGGTSIVYRGERVPHARDMGIANGGDVAVKVLTLSDSMEAPDRSYWRARYLQGAQVARELRHERVVPVLSFGEQNTLTYMIMPLLTGGSLATCLGELHEPLGLHEVASYVAQIASALDYVHHNGIIHRDVKPSNILFDEQRHAYLTDFGLARMVRAAVQPDAAASTSLQDPTRRSVETPTGLIVGTINYMAPEQIKGDSVSPAADIYSLGVVLYQLVTRQLPFQQEIPMAVAMQHLQDVPPAPSRLRSDLPEEAESVILRALAKLPDARFPSAGALAAAFWCAIRGEDEYMSTDERASVFDQLAGNADAPQTREQRTALLDRDRDGPEPPQFVEASAASGRCVQDEHAAYDEPPVSRRFQLRSLYDANLAAGKPPYAGVRIGSLDELRWILFERGWSGDDADDGMSAGTPQGSEPSPESEIERNARQRFDELRDTTLPPAYMAAEEYRQFMDALLDASASPQPVDRQAKAPADLREADLRGTRRGPARCRANSCRVESGTT